MIRVIRQHENRVPESLQKLLTRAGGLNQYGQPMYRFVWGASRLEILGGKWTDTDPITGQFIREVFEMRRVPKYGPPFFNEERFYIERWYGPSFFGTPRQWAASTVEIDGLKCIREIGLYPSRGDYVHFFTVEDKNKGFLQLTWPRAVWLASVVYTSELARKKTISQQRDIQKAKQEAQERSDHDVIEAAIGDVKLGFAGSKVLSA